MASNNVKGSQLIMKFNGLNISCQTSCEFNFETEMLLASAVASGRWKEFLAGVRSWSMNVAGKLLMQAAGADVKNIIQAVFTGLPVFLEFTSNTGSDMEFVISGYAIPNTGGISGPLTGKAGWTVNFQGTGPFETNIQDFGLIIDAMPIEATPPIIFDTTL